ncbi:MAG: zf-HC2 domain-containing protein [Clostridiales bacterium]|nr:zf-HC2 domain-containing protein [Clostridiales bacterium]
MSISCGVMTDLLPLYQEGLLGAESVALVEEHLSGCPHCSRTLEEIRKVETPSPDAQAPLRGVVTRLRRDRWRRIGIAVALVVFAGTVLFYHTSTRQYLRYSPDLVALKEVSPGQVVVEGRGVTGVWSQIDVPSQEEIERGMSSGTTVYLSFFDSDAAPADSPGTFTTSFEEQGTLRVYYVYPGELAVQLYGPPGEDMGLVLLPHLALNYYWRLAAIVATVLAVLLLLLHKKARARWVLLNLLCLSLCYVAAHFAIKGTDGTSWDMVRDLGFILVAWVSASVAVLLMLQQRRAFR